MNRPKRPAQKSPATGAGGRRTLAVAALLCFTMLLPGCSSPSNYEGERINIFPWSLPHGAGTYRSPEGWTYTGQWRKGKREGKGACVFANGEKFTGTWKNDKRHGPGISVWPNGLSIESVWEDGKLVEVIQ